MNIAPVAPPPAIPAPVVPVAVIGNSDIAVADQPREAEDEATASETEARIKREKLEVADPCSANGDADRLDLKIEKMKQDDKSPLPGHASDHRVINYHSRPFLYPPARTVPPIQPSGRGYDRRISPSHGAVQSSDPAVRSSHVRPLSPISLSHHQQSHLTALPDGHSPEVEGAVLNLARNSYDNHTSGSPVGPVLYDSLSPYHHPHHHPAVSMHSRAHMYQRSPYPAHVPQSHPNSHYLMTPYHQRPIQTPTSIPVSVVTSGSEHLRKMNANTGPAGMVMNQVDRNIIMNAPVYRNNTAGRRTIPNSVISTGTRTTSRQGVAQHMNGNTSHSLPHPPPLQHQPTSLSPNMSLTVSSSSSIGMNGSGMSSPMKPPPIPSGNPSKPFMCPICNKNLASKNVYQLHLRSHNGEKPFACNLCGNAFSQKTSLTRHMRSHTGERPFSCQVCAKRFADKERIKIHMRTHTGEKPFSCDVCHKQFSQKSTVKRHMSVHTGEKPFKCRHCGKGFANRGNLVAHEKTHTSPPSLPSSSTHPLTRSALMSPDSPL